MNSSVLLLTLLVSLINTILSYEYAELCLQNLAIAKSALITRSEFIDFCKLFCNEYIE